MPKGGARSCRTLVILCHGLPSGALPEPSDAGYPAIMEGLAGRGFGALFFNFRGCGESGGDLDPVGWAKDLESVIDAASDWKPKVFDRGALVASSAGAAAALTVAARDERISGVATLAAPSSFDFLLEQAPPRVFVKHFRNIGLIRDPEFPPSVEKWVQGFREVEAKAWIGKVSPRPLLIVHGEKDELVPVGQAQELFSLAGEPKEIFIVPDAGHRLRLIPAAIDRVSQWLEERFGAAAR